MPSSPALAIEATGLVKSFGATRAVDGVDLEVPAGAVYGVLGPNGAGKTTLLQLASGSVFPTRGAVELLGERVGPLTVLCALLVLGSVAVGQRTRVKGKTGGGA